MPASAEEAAQGLLWLAQAGRSVHISGPLTMIAHVGETVRGAPMSPEWSGKAQTQLSTARLQGIKTYAPDDQYITVGAGTMLFEVQDFLAKQRKQLPLASPWPEASVGGLVAANINAPLRMRYGAMRDVVLCGTVALADGRVIRVGRPIVKNVAGYDLTRVFIGSHGTLGLLTDVTLKVIVQPRAKRTLLIPLDDMRHGLLHTRQLLPLALNASAIVLCKGHTAAIAWLPESPYLLAYTAEGLSADVEAELDQVRRVLHSQDGSEPIEIETLSGIDIWTSMLAMTTGTSILARVGVPAKNLPGYMQDQAIHQSYSCRR